MPRHRHANGRSDPALENFERGFALVQTHPLFAPLCARCNVWRDTDAAQWHKDAWAIVGSGGAITVHPTRRGEPEEWQYVLAHCLLHLGFGHLREMARPREWNAACDIAVARFLRSLQIGRAPASMRPLNTLPTQHEERLYDAFIRDGVPEEFRYIGTGVPGEPDMHGAARNDRDWTDALAAGLAQAAASAVNVAGGLESHLGARKQTRTAATQARDWFVNAFPLLGSLAAAFQLIEDPAICQRLGISVAAVDPEASEIYINPAAGLDPQEIRFVIAHELLHVGLNHVARRRGRDPFLWNVACDYVINGWLLEMGVGALPGVGALYDKALTGLSAEAIYDIVVTDLRRNRKLATLCGSGRPDILERGHPDWWRSGNGMDLDAFYRRALMQGLVYHQDGSRGLLPAGLVEEIRALDQPPISWDVELAQWFDDYFAPVEMVRTYSRPSRRQSSTPDIPRPRWIPSPNAMDGRTFGVLLDTSGSMDRSLLAKALGAIASYSMARDVPAARVVFCDAATYDEGYMSPEDIAGRVRVRGRGGTVLQPGVDLLEKAADFPKDGPILIITDGYCDRIHVRREHAFLLPEGNSLPFPPRGKVFRIR